MTIAEMSNAELLDAILSTTAAAGTDSSSVACLKREIERRILPPSPTAGLPRISLRDHFAGLAMQGFIAAGDWRWFHEIKKGGPEDPAGFADEAIAKASARIAEAMLAEREKRK